MPRGQDVESNVPFHHFRHETVQCSAASRHELKHVRTLMPIAENALDGFDLSSSPPDATEELLFVFGGMGQSICLQFNNNILRYSI